MSQDPRPATDPTSLASLAEWAAAEAHLLLPQPAEWLADREHRRSLEAITSCLRPAPTLQFFGDQRPAAAPPHPGPPTSAAPGAAAPPQDPPPPAPAAAPPLHQRRPGHATRGALLTSIFAEATGRGAMDESLGTQIATSAVPFNRVPSTGRLGSNRLGSGPQAAGEPVTWDEMGQLGLHKALNEYYKLSASQRNLRLCERGGPPGLLCGLLHAVLVPQLPAALAPPALFAAAGWLLYGAAWLLYQTAALTVPLALWLAFSPDGSLALLPTAAAAAARVHPAAGAAAQRLHTAAADLQLPSCLAGSPGARLLVLPLLLVLLRAAEGAVLRRHQERWEQRQRRVTAAEVQAQYAGWRLPGNSTAAAASEAAAAAAAEQRQQAALQALQREVGQLWHAVYGGESLPAEQLQSMQDIAAAVARLCKDTGVEVPAAAADAASGSPGSSRLLADLVGKVRAAVGVA